MLAFIIQQIFMAKRYYLSHMRAFVNLNRSVTPILAHTPVRKAVIWKILHIFNFFPENIFIITRGRLFNFSHYIVSFC